VVTATAVGKCNVRLGSNMPTVNLDRVLHVPEFSANLLSVSQLCDAGYTVKFDRLHAVVLRHGKIVGEGKRDGNVYTIPLLYAEQAQTAKTAHANALDLWHLRLGHADKNAIARMAESGAVRGIDLTEKAQGDVCGPCMEGKMVNPSVLSRTNLSKVPGASIHTDVAHLNVPSLGGAKYFVTFLDEATGHILARPIKRKNEAATELQKYVAWIERQTQGRVLKITMDGASRGDYAHAVKHLVGLGVEVHPTAPYTAMENGRAERINRTLNGSVRSMLAQAGLPEEFWAECLLHATAVRNVIPKANKSKSPLEELTGQKPSVAHYRVFGSLAWVRVQDKVRKKLDGKAKRGVLLSTISYGKYRIWLEKEAKIVFSRTCRIVETEFPAQSWHKSNAMRRKFHWNDEPVYEAPTVSFTTPSGGAVEEPPAYYGGAPSQRSINGGGESVGEQEDSPTDDTIEVSRD